MDKNRCLREEEFSQVGHDSLAFMFEVVYERAENFFTDLTVLFLLNLVFFL